MNAFLLSIHVLAAIVFVGTVTVAASMFPPVARRALASDAPTDDVPVLHTLHRISRVYALLAIAVPVFGIGTASAMGVMGDAWVIVSTVLTVVAAAILGLKVVPDQARVVAALAAGPEARAAALACARTLSMTTGVFALTWAVVVVLMITRPGSTTGV